MLGFLFPGQGSQYVGMGSDFFAAFSIARETFEEANDLLSWDLSKLIFSGREEELKRTKNSQIAIYVTSIAILRVISQQFPFLRPSVCSGLSLGEYTALTAIGSLSWQEGVSLVRLRGEFMEEASQKHPGTMAAVIGADLATVQEALSQHAKGEVWLSNVNCPGQIVLSGTHRGMDRLEKVLKAQGAKKILPLAVSGAFHSGLMSFAKEKLSPFLSRISLKEGSVDLVMNVPGDYVFSKEDRLEHLTNQVTGTVYWEKGVRRMKEEGVSLFLEIGCGTTLRGMNRKMGFGSETFGVDKVEDLERLVELGEKRYGKSHS